MEQFVSRVLERSGLTAAELARRSGLSRSTQFRIDTGRTDPRLETLRELAIAGGLDIRVELRQLSDPDAARAARSLLEQDYDASLGPAVEKWMSRLRRLAGDDPVQTVLVAGNSSSLLHREGAVPLAGSADDLKLAAAGANSGAAWILSGRGALARFGAADDLLAGVPRVIYAEDAHRVLRSLSHLEPTRAERADVIVAPFTVDLLRDELVEGALRFVAPIQALIDGAGLGGASADVAETIARSW